jgi:glycosyltransferase involved in cell wall biosynthesis/predicted Zn-dependent protease/predicted O-methyltransferase YrrM
MARLLFGPCDDPTFFDRFLRAPAGAGRWGVFGAGCPSFEAACAGLGGEPEALVVWPGYTSVPAWVWSAPVPVAAAAHDPNLLWHSFRHNLPLADVVLTDAPSAQRLRRAGLQHVRAANLFGIDRHFAAALDDPEGERDIDLVFVGNVNPAVQGARLPWLARVAALADKYRVAVAAGVFGAEYRSLLRRAKLAFNRSIRGECNLRALEAASSGAVLLQEADNEEVKEYLEPGAEYAPYGEDDFEGVVGRLLADEPRRRAIAGAARERARWYTFEALVRSALAVGGKGWSDVTGRARERLRRGATVPLAPRVWQRASNIGPDADPGLDAALAAAGERHAPGVLARTPAEAEGHFAAAGGNRVSLAGRAVALAELGRREEALAAAREAVAALEAEAVLTPEESDSVPYPPRAYLLRAAWERAGYDRPDHPEGERREKARLLRGRTLLLAAEITGASGDWAAAAGCCPEWPHLRAALGAALLREGRAAEAVEHLRSALAANPFDNAAARARAGALAESGRADEAERLRARRRLLAKGAPGLVAPLEPPATRTSAEESGAEEGERATGVAAEPTPPRAPAAGAPAPTQPAPPPAPRPAPRTRFVELPRAAFAARFGEPDTSAALCGFTPPADTHAVLALVAHLRPRRLLEVGTAAGHMAANLTAFSPDDAVVYSLGVVAEDAPRPGTQHQDYEVPRRDQFARHLNHFGTGHKAMLATADSRSYDFGRLAPLDFAFVDGGHDLQTAASDSLAAYAALRQGGVLCWHDLPSSVPWVEVEQAVARLAFPEPVYKVAGTQVAFLVKGEGLGASAGAASGRIAIAWDGEFDRLHSLARVNRALCAELAARGHDLAVSPPRPGGVPGAPLPLPPELAPLAGRELPGAVFVRHRWPPDFTPPAGDGPFVLFQPWEYGRLTREWLEPILAAVDEVWCYSRSVLRAYAASGVPDSRLALVPPGVVPDLFRPGLDPLPLPTQKRVKLLFVGGTIPRKGFDALLIAYRRAFSRRDDVCLVVKDVGAGTFYRGQTAEGAVRAMQEDPEAPEVLYLAEDVPEGQVPRLFAACDALVHPYRGEGFGLPVLEAMACGLPVAVTAGGPTDEFVPLSACWRVPAKLRYFEEEAVGGMPTCGRPWWLEPDPEALVAILKEVAGDAEGRRRRGAAARRAALGWTWARAAAAVEDRVRVLRARTPVRFARRAADPSPHPAPARAESLAAPAAFAPALTLRSDLPVVVDVAAGRQFPPSPEQEVVPAVADRPRVSLTMIVKNEEHNLPECLAGVRDLVDEAVVIDTGSSDRTRQIAESFGCVVGEFPWIDHFAAARNAALEKATGDYALWMDADDRLDPENRDKLRELLAELPAGNAAFVMKCLCASPGAGAAGTAVDHVRLFRLHPAHRWSYRVHEQVLPALRATGADVRWSEVTVRHVGYADPAVRSRKLDRDLRLLRIDEAERPGDPFTLFNLGSVYHELGHFAAAAEALERSLAGSHVRDSIVRKAYALLARCRHQSGDRNGAEAACREARTHYPDDAELLFLSAGLAREGGDWGAAEGLYRKLVGGSEGPHFASVDTGLRAVKGRHNLAVLLLEQNRLPEAEGLWRAALVHDPLFLPAQVGLGELYARAGNPAGLERQASELEGAGPEGAAEAAVLRARWRSARGDHAGAVATLEEALAKAPGALGLRVALSHAHIAAESPPEVLEASFRGVLEADPHNAQARRNLEVLYRKTGRWLEGVLDGGAHNPPA